MTWKDHIRAPFYVCVPLFLLFALFTQMQCATVIDIHNKVESTAGVNIAAQESSSISTAVTFIPAVGPYMEVSSITTLFNAMVAVKDEYSAETAAKIFSSMEESYADILNTKGSSLYLNTYETTMKNLIGYFKSYSTFGNLSPITIQLKADLTENISMLQFTTAVKTLVYILLLFCGIVGVFMYKGQRATNSMKI